MKELVLVIEFVEFVLHATNLLSSNESAFYFETE